MLLEMFFSFLGSWSRQLVDWLMANPFYLLLIYGSWLILLSSGKWQLKRNIDYLEKTTLAVAEKHLSLGKPMDSRLIYEEVYQAWKQQIHRLGWFIPHRWELWPLPARIELVQRRIGFSPQWVQDVLSKNNISPRSD